MKRSLSFWQFVGFVFTSVVGTLLHFLYEWTGESVIVGLFSAVNESIFEHMKLLFFPMLLFAFIEAKYIGEEYDNFWCAKLVGILVGVGLIPVIYYTYTGIFGVNADWFNIIIFFITAAISYMVETRIMESGRCSFIQPNLAKFILIIIAAVFIVFTFFPPKIPLFEDPITAIYGIQ
ncbi:MAG: hypothetical protein IIW73_02600 [Clostridia bacterium]|nr:hypothetical protein [Clostridia bacterium]